MPDSTLLPEPPNHLSSPPLDEEQGSSLVPPHNDHPENSTSASQCSKRQRSLGPDDAKSDSKRTCTIAHGEKGLNLWDYSGTAKSMIHKVLQCYKNKIFTVDAYSDDTKQAEIVHSLWADVCESIGQEFELTAALQSMVSDKKKIQQTNKNLYVMLSTGGTFSFKNQKAPGIRYSDNYDLIKLESLALVMTKLENCIEEWSSGKYVLRPLDEDVQHPCYLAHLADVKKWPNSGAKAKEKVTGYLDDEEEESWAKADLEGRTGETNSKEEPDDEDGGDVENNMEVTEES